jgi:hypothetical protein
MPSISLHDRAVMDINAGELFFRNLKCDEFDVSEIDLSETLLAKERGDRVPVLARSSGREDAGP